MSIDNKVLTCYIIDDEPHALDTLRRMIAYTPMLDMKGAYTSSDDLLGIVDKEPVDLIISDIHMPKITGIDMIKSILTNTPVKVIFTTGYSEYAAEGFNMNIIDYLMKPIEYSRFLLAIQKAQLAFRNTETVTGRVWKQNYLFIRKSGQGGQSRIDHDDIDFIEGEGKYSAIHTGKTKHTDAVLLSEWETKLPHPDFIRVHKSYIVRLNSVINVEPDLLGLRSGSQIPLGRTYRDALYALLGLK